MVDSRRRRAGCIVLGIIVGIGLLVLALALVVHFTSPSADVAIVAVPEKEIPADWLAESRAPEPTAGRAPWSSTGSLVLSADGRPFGDENYRLDVSTDGASLTSTGRFWFKVVLATVHIAFQQQWEGTADLRPATYSLHLDAPLGQGQEIDGRLEGERYVVRRNGAETAIPVAPGRTVILGMFSTYAIVPVLFAEREEDGVATFDALALGGPPGAGSGKPGDLPSMTVERAGTADVRIDGLSIAVDRLRIRSPYGDGLLYAKGREFLALTAGTADRPLTVYRSDYFPDGFSLAVAE